MKDKATTTRCYSPAIWILFLALGLLALLKWDNLANSPLHIVSLFVPSSMEDGEAKDRAAESGNAFSRIFTSCTSFVRSLTKSHSDPMSQTRKQSHPNAMFKRSTSRAKGKLQKINSQSHTETSSHHPPHQDIMSSPLYKVIANGSFWTLPDEDLLILIRDEFPNELNRLKNAYSLRSTGITRPSTPSLSQILYQDNFDEINRTLIGVLALRWIWLNEYQTFIGSHPASPITLQPDSFKWMRTMFKSGLQEPIDIYTLVLSMLINDLGKDHNLASDYAHLKNIDISNVNHDMILLHAVEAGMVPALDLLPATQKAQLITGIKLGAEFNFGQLAQGENAPASLSGLLDMRGEERAFEMRFLEQLLDLSGAAGHEDWTCARKMIEPIFQSYRNVFDAAGSIISGTLSLREAYDIIPTRKLQLLRTAGWEGHLDLNKPEDRAQARLFCMGNTNSKDTANLYVEAFTNGIDEATRAALVKGLNVDGSVDEPAVQPTYAPAMLAKATGNTNTGSKEEKVTAIAAILGFLARCFEVSDEEKRRFRESRVMVIERDVRCIDGVVGGEEFRKDCHGVMRGCGVPEGVVANVDRR